LISASSAGHLPVVNLLLAKDAQVNLKNDTQQTALFYACSKGNTDIVKQLLKSGAQVNVTDETGATPLHRYSLAPYLLLFSRLTPVGYVGLPREEMTKL
jgi:26S proteasome non-ATPase regulatory subunit 10